MNTQNLAYHRRIIVICVTAVAVLLLGISLIPLTAFARSEVGGAEATSATAVTPTDVGLAYVTLPDSNQVALLDTAAHTYIDSIDMADGGCYNPTQAVMAPDEATVFVACNSSVAVINTSNNTVVTNINLSAYVHDITFVQGGSYALASNPYDYVVRVIDTTTFAVIDTIPTPYEPYGLAAHPYLDRVYVAASYGGLLVIDTTTFNIVDTIYLGDYSRDVIVAPDGQLIFVSNSSYGVGLHVIDANTNTLVTTIPVPNYLYDLSITPDGETLFSGADYYGVHVFDIPTLSYVTTISGVGNIYNTAVNCDGSELYVGGSNNTVPVIDTESYNVVSYIPLGGYYYPRGIAICPGFAISGMVLLPSEQSHDGALGETVVHELTLVNASDVSDSYNLALGAYDWNTSLSTATVGPVPPGEQITFTVSVVVPSGAEWYDVDSVAITSTSVTSPTVTDTAVVTTVAYAPPDISVAPDSLVATLLVNEETTTTLTISNGNALTLTYELLEKERGTAVAYGPLETSPFVVAPSEQSLPTTERLNLPASPSAAPFAAGDVIQSWPSGLSGTWGIAFDGGNNTVWVSNPSPDWGGNNTIYQYSPTGTPTGQTYSYSWNPSAGPADIAYNWNTDMMWIMDVGIDNCIHEIDPITGVTGNTICPGFTNSQRGLAYDPISDTYFAGSWNDSMIHHFDASGNMLDEVYVGLAVSGLAYNPDTQHLFVTINDYPSNSPVYVLDAANNYNLIGQFIVSEGFGSYSGAGLEFDCNGYLWAVDQATETVYQFESGEMTNLCNEDLPWLSASPVTGTLTGNSSDTITVGFNATDLQPGEYLADIVARSNDPVTPRFSVPVTLTVNPTTNMGYVEGTITDASTGLPLAATVIAQAQPYTITADAGTGYYQLWLDAGAYTLQVSADGYVTETQSVTIVAQQGTTQDFDLVLNVPVLNITHEDMEVAQDVGQMATRALTITNDGPAPLEFEILKASTGFTPLAYVRDTLNLPVPETAVTSLLSSGPLAESPSVPHIGGNPVLIIQDYYPWGYDSIQQILNANSIFYDQVDSSYMATVDLSAYEMVIIPGVQGDNFYNNWNDHIARFEEYVARGGALWLSGATQGQTPLLPDDVGNQYGPDDYNDVLLPNHPWVANVPGQIYGSSASHNYFTNLFSDSKVVAESTSYGEATLVDYQMGAGRIFFTGQTLEIAWAYNWDAALILENSLLDMYVWEPGNLAWLVVEPISGTVAGYSTQAVQATFDATDLQPGTYTADMIINSNDPANGSQIVPVTMTVSPASGMGRVMGSVTDQWTAVPLTATVQMVGVYTDTADPNYSIWADAGVYNLVATADGYMTATYTVTIVAGTAVVQDIELEPAQPRLDDLPTELVVTAVPNTTFSQTFVITNSGPLPLEYNWQEIPPVLLTARVPTDLSGKIIMYDRAHGQNDLYNYTILAGNINSAGGLITENFAYPITASVLQNVDVLWIDCCGYTGWTFGELLVVMEWMEAGGAVLVHSSNYPAAADVAGIFNITYQCCQYSYGTTTNIRPHPTTVGVDEIYLDYSYDVLTYTQAAVAPVLDTNGFAQVVAQEQNGGKMVVVDSLLFDDYRITQADNQLLALNVMNWLADPAYGDVPWTAVSPISGTIPAHSTQTVTLMIDTANLPVGTYEAMLAMEHNDPDRLSPTLLPLTLEVEEQAAAISLTPVNISGSGLPGEPVTYTLTVQNTGNGSDTFDVAVSGNWSAAASILTTDELLPNQSQQFTVIIQVPDSAVPGSSDETVVMVTSQYDDSVTQSVTLTTTSGSVIVHIYLPVIMKP